MEVSTPKPIDVSGVRDPGMAALITLAVSLGWNAMQKHNQPVVITALDGAQKRLPTNTSIRMSVYQTTLSAIMLHSVEHEPTLELMEKLIKEFKLSPDHARRLRLAVGETPQAHRERVLNERAAEQKRVPDEHLVQTVGDIPLVWEEPPEPTTPVVEALPAPEPETAPATAVDHDDPKYREPPVDGKEHGTIVSVKPYIAQHTNGTEYHSESTLERIWSDGFIDYACVVCGAAGKAPRSVAGHRQVHTKAGEVGAAPGHRVRTGDGASIVVGQTEATRLQRQLDRIKDIVGYDDSVQVARLKSRVKILEAENQQLRDDWQALQDLIGGKRK